MTKRNISLLLATALLTVFGAAFFSAEPTSAQSESQLAQLRDDEIDERDRRVYEENSGSSSTGTSCGGADTSIIDCDDNDHNAIFTVLAQVIRILTFGIGAVAVGAVIFGAILYGMSGDNPENVKKAKGIWINVVIGLVLFAFLVGITNFLIPGGVF